MPEIPLRLDKELVLALIKEELKSRKFFNTLQSLGLNNSYYQPHLDELIIVYVGLDIECDKTFDFYYHLMERCSAMINENEGSVREQALVAYEGLVAQFPERLE